MTAIDRAAPSDRAAEGKTQPPALKAHAHTDSPIWSCFHQPLVALIPHTTGLLWFASAYNPIKPQSPEGWAAYSSSRLSTIRSAPRAPTMNRWLSFRLPTRLSPHHRQTVPMGLHPCRLEAPAMTIIIMDKTECLPVQGIEGLHTRSKQLCSQEASRIPERKPPEETQLFGARWAGTWRE